VFGGFWAHAEAGDIPDLQNQFRKTLYENALAAFERGELKTRPTNEIAIEQAVRNQQLWPLRHNPDGVKKMMVQKGLWPCHDVEAYDLATDGIDFLQQTKVLPGIDAMVTNPPFIKAAEFVTHGLTLVPLVIVLERIQFLESRVEFWAAGKLARIHFFQNRVPRMHRADWTGKRASGGMTLAWFAFTRDHDGSTPRLDWIRWRRT
jgi:hypothetical protein